MVSFPSLVLNSSFYSLLDIYHQCPSPSTIFNCYPHINDGLSHGVSWSNGLELMCHRYNQSSASLENSVQYSECHEKKLVFEIQVA